MVEGKRQTNQDRTREDRKNRMDKEGLRGTWGGYTICLLFCELYMPSRQQDSQAMDRNRRAEDGWRTL